MNLATPPSFDTHGASASSSSWGWWSALTLLVMVAACTVSSGEFQMTEDRTTTITVEVPNRLIASVGYSVGCSGSQAKVGMSDVEPELETIAQGLLEPVGVGGSGRVPPTAVWRVLIDLAPASCFVDLEARDSQGEVVCSATEPLRVDRSASTQKYVLLSCEEPLGEARLTIESPATPESDEIGTIAFTATCFGNEDIFLTPEPQFPIVLEGSLELGGEDELDLEKALKEVVDAK